MSCVPFRLPELDDADIEIRLSANEGWAAAPGRNAVVVLATSLTPELLREGMARDIVRLVQDRRKELQLNFTDRIELGLVTEDRELQLAIDENAEHIKQETLASQLSSREIVGAEAAQREVADQPLAIYINVP